MGTGTLSRHIAGHLAGRSLWMSKRVICLCLTYLLTDIVKLSTAIFFKFQISKIIVLLILIKLCSILNTGVDGNQLKPKVDLAESLQSMKKDNLMSLSLYDFTFEATERRIKAERQLLNC